MSTSKFDFRTIQEIRNFISVLAEFVLKTEKRFLDDDTSIGAGFAGSQELAGDLGLIREMSADDWRALLEGALHEIQRLIDGDDKLPDVDVREVIASLSSSNQAGTADRLIEHRINQAATQLRALMYEGVHTTPSNVVDRLKRHSNIGSGPYEGYWEDFVQEHSDEIMLELIADLETEVENDE